MADTVRVGCFSGFWGDSSLGAEQLVKGDRLDYLVGDYLAEVTMGILARQRVRDLQDLTGTKHAENAQRWVRC